MRDDRSLIETLATLDQVFASAGRIADGRPLDIGACGLRRRLWPKTGLPANRPTNANGTPADVDSRLHRPIAAAWLACVIAVAGSAGVDRLCTFEAAGERGIVGPRGEPTPVHAVLVALASERARAPCGMVDRRARRRGIRLRRGLAAHAVVGGARWPGSEATAVAVSRSVDGACPARVQLARGRGRCCPRTLRYRAWGPVSDERLALARGAHRAGLASRRRRNVSATNIPAAGPVDS